MKFRISPIADIVASFLRDQRGAIQVEQALLGAATSTGPSAPGDAIDGACQHSGATQSHGLPAGVDR
jgi:hypothetical protein